MPNFALQSPLCLLLGWAWAPDRQLEKFVTLHTDAGRTTVSYTIEEQVGNIL
jgi:hypothetical protein